MNTVFMVKNWAGSCYVKEKKKNIYIYIYIYPYLVSTRFKVLLFKFQIVIVPL